MTMLMFTAANPHASRLASSPDHETAEGRRLEGRGYTVINLLIPLERVQKNEASVTRVQVCLPIPAEARASRKAMLVAVAAICSKVVSAKTLTAIRATTRAASCSAPSQHPCVSHSAIHSARMYSKSLYTTSAQRPRSALEHCQLPEVADSPHLVVCGR